VEELFNLIVKTYGLAGVLMMAPVVALVFIWKHAEKLQKKLDTANDRVNEVHAKRVEDAKQVAEKLMAMVQEHGALSKETNIALDKVGDLLTILQRESVELRVNLGRK
jgi:hypothetical protein